MNEKFSLKIEDEEIIFADLTNRENLEAVIIAKSGNVYLFNFQNNLINKISEIDLKTEYYDGSFEYGNLNLNQKEFLQIHSFENYICLVQKFGQKGIVFNLENCNFKKYLERSDYCVEHCTFPITFYRKDNQTFLIHGTDWNRLDITCLETDELLTDRIVDYDTQSNYFDYFHSSLLMSPDEKHFTSNGWHWHPFGQIYCFSVEDFLQKFESSHKNIDLTEDCYNLDWDRPLCWIDNQTVAVGLNQQVYDEKQRKYASEILLIDIAVNKAIKRINFDGFGLTATGNVFGELFYDIENKYFIGLNNKSGLLIKDIDGKEIYKNTTFTSYNYSQKHKFFYQLSNSNQEIEVFSIASLIQ